ncbi:MAG: hypothetical protein FWD21_03470 [Peptococcaceae bacterium]|nr:hypothetical protein [Peptococcaceae bacterium]
MIKKKIVCIFCSMILLIGLFAACTNQEKNKETPPLVSEMPTDSEQKDLGDVDYPDADHLSQDDENPLETNFVVRHNSRDWEGDWVRSFVGTEDAEISISKVVDDSLKFSFFGYYTTPNGVPHIGDLEGTAFFESDNRAVYKHESQYGDKEVQFDFVMYDENIMIVEGEKQSGIFGEGVYMNGVYKKRNILGRGGALPRDTKMVVVREGYVEVMTGQLAFSSTNGYAIYILPDFKFDEENGVVYVTPNDESGLMYEIMLTIYEVDPDTPVTEQFQEYYAFIGQNIVSEFQRFTYDSGTYEIQFMYPEEAAEGGRVMLYAMADTICALP